MADHFEARLREPNGGAQGAKGHQKGRGERWIPRHERSSAAPQRVLALHFEDFREVEILKAIRVLAGAKAPGPDGLPVEVYKNLLGALPAVTGFISAMVKTGAIPRASSEVFIAPLNKPRKIPQL